MRQRRVRPSAALVTIVGAAAVAAGVALTAAPAAAGSAAGSSVAASAVAPKLAVHFPNLVVAPRTGGQSRDFRIAHDLDEVVLLKDVTVTFDATGLGTHASVRPEFETPRCTTAGAVLTCALGDLAVDRGGHRPGPRINVRAADGAAVGHNGTVRVTLAARDLSPATHTFTVTVAEGVDLTNVGPDQERRRSEPGGKVGVPVAVRNSGTTAVDGSVLRIDTDYALAFARRYRNCGYTDYGAVCRFDTRLEPGREYALADEVGFNLRTDTLAPSGVRAAWAWYTPADALEWRDDWNSTRPVPGSNGLLALVERAPVRGLAGEQTDVNAADNGASLHVEVAGDNPADLAAVGPRVTGEVGQTVTVKVGVRNHGPASLDLTPDAEPVTAVRIAVPRGTTAVAVPRSCAPIVDGETRWDLLGAPGAAEYRCLSAPALRVGSTYTWALGLRIDARIVDATGRVVANAGRYTEEPDKDPNPGNDTAKIVVNPAPGPGDPSSPGPGDPSSPGSPAPGKPGLPVTGTSPAPIAVAGAVLLALGGFGYLVARRRRWPSH